MPTGGFVYDRHILCALRSAGRLAGSIVLPGAYPQISAAARAAAERMVQGVPDGAALIVDGLAFSPLLEAFAEAASRLSLYALVHHPLCDETGVSPGICRQLFERERRALALAQGVVVTSAHTALRLFEFGVPAERVHVVRPGAEARCGRARPLRTSLRDEEPVLLCVASLTPRKGQDVLLRALVRLRHCRWRLVLIGPARDPAFAGRLRRFTRQLGIERRIAFMGAVPAATLARQYRSADLFVLPTYYEGYGIAVAEAAAYGLSIIASDVGGVREAIAGARHCLLPADDPVTLAKALRAFFTIGCVSQGWCAPSGARHRSWRTAGREFVAVLEAMHVA
jgi:glycosyltransferase involved in cell wall biosynthesis